jgi:hypothetical protein
MKDISEKLSLKKYLKTFMEFKTTLHHVCKKCKKLNKINSMKTKIFLFIALIISVLVNAQERIISGKITYNSGSAVAGVNVSIKGASQLLKEVVSKDGIQGEVAGVQVNKKSKMYSVASKLENYDLHSMPAPQMPPRMAPEAVSDNEENNSQKEMGFKFTDKIPNKYNKKCSRKGLRGLSDGLFEIPEKLNY